MTVPVRTAVIGLGRMGSFHAAALTSVPELEVVALADVRRSALDAAANLYPAATTYDDPARALTHPELEAVLLATPTTTHPVLTLSAIEADLHVLCEKPLALDPATSNRLGTLAQQSNLVLQMGYWRRFSPPWRSARDAIATGRIGDPVLLRLSQWDADPPPPEFCDPQVSGGLAIDCGVHEFDLAAWLTGRSLIGVRAEAMPIVDDAVAAVGDVDNLVAVGELENGARVIIDLSRNARYGDDVRSEVLGTNGALFVDTLPTARTRIGDADGLTTLGNSEADDAMLVGVRDQAAAFARAIRNGGGSYPDAFDDARAVRAALATMESLRIGAAMSLPGSIATDVVAPLPHRDARR
jgi:predicted dehydrogenase